MEKTKEYFDDSCDNKENVQVGNMPKNWSKTILEHKRKKRFKCEFCTKKYRELSNLKVHLITHTGEKPLKCKICSKTFKFQSILNVHLV